MRSAAFDRAQAVSLPRCQWRPATPPDEVGSTIEPRRFQLIGSNRSAGVRCGGRGKDEAALCERAAGTLGGRIGRGPVSEQTWTFGERVVERATGAVFWIDELHSTRADVVGVVSDDGALVRWVRKVGLRRGQTL